jgi:hypothetical protein
MHGDPETETDAAPLPHSRTTPVAILHPRKPGSNCSFRRQPDDLHGFSLLRSR